MTPKPAPKPRPCVWRDDPDWGVWRTSCKHDFNIETGTPTENGMRYCCYCGKPLKEAKARE